MPPNIQVFHGFNLWVVLQKLFKRTLLASVRAHLPKEINRFTQGTTGHVSRNTLRLTEGDPAPPYH
jgi:hypothetical protein